MLQLLLPRLRFYPVNSDTLHYGAERDSGLLAHGRLPVSPRTVGIETQTFALGVKHCRHYYPTPLTLITVSKSSRISYDWTGWDLYCLD